MAVTTILCGSGLLLVEAIIVTLFPNAIIGIFNKDPAVLAIGKTILLIQAWGFLLNAFSDVLSNCVKGMGRSIGPTIINIAANMLPRVLWVLLIFPLNRTVTWMYMCFPLSWLISSVTLTVYYIAVRKKLDRELALETAQ